ncbi:nucleoside hydrolase [uncultured Peptoniphilus sp.]|uniref:nucleoside hydrolase n=1 Tax=uncultured Peptoniphilus sp. TaxID=254354 RepID=UPI00280374B0|nr:nucleoside hydrolase [uncultured Peptoniphilus sp.]
MKKVLVDFDNTINVRGCDIDDAFALFFLLSHKDVEVVGITTTFGNSNEDDTYNSTVMMNKDLGIEIPLKKGGIYSYDAAKFIKEKFEREKVSLISLGSTTNTMKALALGMDTKNITEFVQMGGITSPLYFKGMVMDELNMSIDFLATNYVLKRIGNPVIITGNNCIEKKYKVKDGEYISKYMRYLDSHMRRWKAEFEVKYKEEELVIWDALTALYVTNPEFFEIEKRKIRLGENMMTGYLEEGEDKEILIPRLKDTVDAMDYVVSTIENN